MLLQRYRLFLFEQKFDIFFIKFVQLPKGSRHISESVFVAFVGNSQFQRQKVTNILSARASIMMIVLSRANTSYRAECEVCRKFVSVKALRGLPQNKRDRLHTFVFNNWQYEALLQTLSIKYGQG